MFPAQLVSIVIVLIIVGLALWVISQIPMDPTVARIIRIIIIVVVCIWLLYWLVGMLPSGSMTPMRR